MQDNAPAGPATGKERPFDAPPLPAGGGAGSAVPGALLLLALCGATYWRALGNGFVPFDDNFYVYDNPVVREGLSLPSLGWAFTTRILANWHPLAWVSHLADVSLFGLEPTGHHAVNLLLHGTASVLLFLLLRRLIERPGEALFAAALFAVHPLHVETVAWVSERKDLLCTVLWFLATLAWLRHLRSPSHGRLLATVLLFALSLMAKPMSITFPLTLLLLDYWPLRRGEKVPPAHLVQEKMPFFAVAAVSSVVTWWAQFQGGSISPLDEIPLWARVANAGISWWAYLGKAIVPRGLSVFYPHPGTDVSLGGAALAFAALAAATAAAALLRRSRPWILWGWLWFLLTLLPVIGLVQVGGQAMADRYLYVPLLGLFVPLAREGGDLARRLLGEERGRKGAVAAAALCTAVLAFVASERVRDWKDGETLFKAALAVDPANYLARNNLGTVYLGRGETEAALEQFVASLRLRPGHPDANYNVGHALLLLGRPDEAIPFLKESIRIQPGDGDAHFQLGNAWVAKGEWGLAAEAYRDAVARDGGNVDARINLGNVVLEMGDLGGAAGWYREALTLAPGHPGATANLLRVISMKEQKSGTGTR